MRILLSSLSIAAALLLAGCVTKAFDKDYHPPAGGAQAKLVFRSLDRGSYSVEFLRKEEKDKEDEKWLRMHGRVSEHRGVAGSGGSFFNEFGEADTEIAAEKVVTLRLNYQASAAAGLPALSCRPVVRLCAVPEARYELLLKPLADRCEVVLLKQVVSASGALRSEPLDLALVEKCPEQAPE